MTTWEIKKEINSSKVHIVRTIGNNSIVLPGLCENEHLALTEIGEYLETGDIVITPTAKTMVRPSSGEPNN